MSKTCLLTFALSSIVIFSSCSKGDSSANPDSKNYNINGVHDITLKSADSVDLPIAITLNTGVQGTVNLTVTGVPQGAVASVKDPSGTPGFSTLIHFASRSAAPGTYPIKINATSSVMGDKTIDANFTITDCSADLLGHYNSTIGTDPNHYTYSKDTLVMGNTAGRVVFKNFSGAGTAVFGDVNCGTHAINVPSQPFNYTYNGTTINGTISGSGSAGGANGHSFIYVLYTITASGQSSISNSFTMTN